MGVGSHGFPMLRASQPLSAFSAQRHCPARPPHPSHAAPPRRQVLVSLSRHPAHIKLLVREGGVPALLAAVLAHLHRPDVCKASLSVLKNIVADDAAAMRVSGQGAYRIILAVMQAHNCAEQIELVRQ